MNTFFELFKQSVMNFYIFTKKDYIEVYSYSIDNIIKHMEDYAIELIKYRISYYHNSIFLTNIKRFYKLTNINNKILILFTIFIIDTKYFNIDNIFNYNDIIYYAFSNNKSTILEKLKLIPNYNLIKNIREVFPNLIFNDNINLKKIVLMKQ